MEAEILNRENEFQCVFFSLIELSPGGAGVGDSGRASGARGHGESRQLVLFAAQGARGERAVKKKKKKRRRRRTRTRTKEEQEEQEEQEQEKKRKKKRC